MSYSTYMNIYGWRQNSEIRRDSFEKTASKAHKIFMLTCEPNINSMYWEADKKIGDSLRNWCINEYRRQMNNEGLQPYLFIFCNHDGESDEQVLQAFLDYAKILCYLDSDLLITITSEAQGHEDTVWIMNHDYGVITDSEERKSMDEVLKKIIAQYKLNQAEKQAEEARKILEEVSDEE